MTLSSGVVNRAMLGYRRGGVGLRSIGLEILWVVTLGFIGLYMVVSRSAELGAYAPIPLDPSRFFLGAMVLGGTAGVISRETASKSRLVIIGHVVLFPIISYGMLLVWLWVDMGGIPMLQFFITQALGRSIALLPTWGLFVILGYFLSFMFSELIL